jgi:hypothetical protein
MRTSPTGTGWRSAAFALCVATGESSTRCLIAGSHARPFDHIVISCAGCYLPGSVFVPAGSTVVSAVGTDPPHVGVWRGGLPSFLCAVRLGRPQRVGRGGRRLVPAGTIRSPRGESGWTGATTPRRPSLSSGTRCRLSTCDGARRTASWPARPWPSSAQPVWRATPPKPSAPTSVGRA